MVNGQSVSDPRIAVKYIDLVSGESYDSEEEAKKAYLEREEKVKKYRERRAKKGILLKGVPKMRKELQELRLNYVSGKKCFVSNHKEVIRINNLINTSKTTIKREMLAISICKGSLKNYINELEKEYAEKNEETKKKITLLTKKISYINSL